MLLVGQKLELHVRISGRCSLRLSIRLQLTDVSRVGGRDHAAVHVARRQTAAPNDGDHQSLTVHQVAEFEDQRAQLAVLAAVDLLLVRGVQFIALRDFALRRVLRGQRLWRQRVGGWRL